jgi:hypothetical protein
MAQNALSVTASNPTPPTNTSSIGWTAPDPSFFATTAYATSVAIPGQGTINDIHYPFGGPGATPSTTAPYFDDGFTNTPLAMTLNETGGVNGTTAPAAVNGLLFVAAHATVTDSSGPPAITSAAPESAGLEVNGNISWVNAATGYTHVTRVAAGGLVMTQAIRDAGPNASHASSLSPTTALTPTTTGATAVNNVAAVGHVSTLTVTGTNYNRTSVVRINGVEQPTNYVSATSLTVTNAMGKQTAGAGTLPITVINKNSGIISSSANWTFT